MSVVDLRAFVSHRPDGVVVLCLDGELERRAASTVTDLMDAALEAGSTDLVIDLRDVTSVDVDGLHAVAAAHERVAEAGGCVRLRGASKRIVDLLLMTGLDRTLTIEGP